MKLNLFIQLFLIINCQQLINSLTSSTPITEAYINNPCAIIESTFKNVTEIGEEVIFFFTIVFILYFYSQHVVVFLRH